MNRFKKKFPQILITAIVFVCALCWVYPILLIIFNSFKSYKDMMTDFLSLPNIISFKSYIETWKLFDLPHMLLNTLFYTIIVTLGVVIFAPMAAYKLARTNSKLSKFIGVILILPAMVPFQSYMITMTRFMANIGLSGTRLGYCISMIGMGMTFAVFMINGFVKTVPLELEESAYIDGASKFQTYWKIVFPLLVPIITTVTVLQVLNTWNDVTVNLLMMGANQETMNISNALMSRFSSQASDWVHALPGIVMATIPNIIFFATMQKYIVEGVTAGAVKG